MERELKPVRVAERPKAAVLKTTEGSPEGAENTGLPDSAHPVLVSCLVFLRDHDPDLAALIEAWPNLPEAARAGILALAKAMVRDRT